jgi:hypothetical protein
MVYSAGNTQFLPGKINDCNSNHCAGQTLAPLGNFVISDISSFSEFNMNNQENEDMDTTGVLDEPTSVLDEPTNVLDDTTGVLDDIQLDEIICDLSCRTLCQEDNINFQFSSRKP